MLSTSGSLQHPCLQSAKSTSHKKIWRNVPKKALVESLFLDIASTYKVVSSCNAWFVLMAHNQAKSCNRCMNHWTTTYYTMWCTMVHQPNSIWSSIDLGLRFFCRCRSRIDYISWIRCKNILDITDITCP
jgi:hypothetical protein